MGTPRKLSMWNIPLFKEGMLLTLSRWWALEMAVGNEWGGRSSALLAAQLGEDILSWFTRSKEPLYIDDLEEILEKGLLSLNTMEEDGSIKEIAKKLMTLHQECLQGNFASIHKLRETCAKEAGRSNIKKVVSDDRRDTDESMVDDPERRSNRAPGANPIQMVDPDGWTVVGSRKNKGQRK